MITRRPLRLGGQAKPPAEALAELQKHAADLVQRIEALAPKGEAVAKASGALPDDLECMSRDLTAACAAMRRALDQAERIASRRALIPAVREELRRRNLPVAVLAGELGVPRLVADRLVNGEQPFGEQIACRLWRWIEESRGAPGNEEAASP